MNKYLLEKKRKEKKKLQHYMDICSFWTNPMYLILLLKNSILSVYR